MVEIDINMIIIPYEIEIYKHHLEIKFDRLRH